MRGQIAGNYARRLSVPAADLEDYLTRTVDYDMSDLHLEGLNEFCRPAAEAGLASLPQPLRFPVDRGVSKMRAPP